MSSSVPIDVAIASRAAATNGRECFVETSSGNILPPEGWFMQIAHGLWGENAPKMLRYLTGFPERTCRSAGNGHTGPSGELLYALLRGAQGRAVLDKIMAGSDAPWWQEHLRDKSDADKARAFVKGF